MSDVEIYMVISTGDGATVERLSKDKVIARLNEGYWGDRKIFMAEDFRLGFIDLMEKRGLFIIKGDLVAPKPVEVVKKYDI